MIKTVKKINTFTDRFPTPIDLFEFNPPYKENEYLIGGYYGNTLYPQVALFPSDEEGIILSNESIIHEEGIAKYQELFRRLGYTLL